MSHYTPNPHYAPVDSSERRQFICNCEAEAGSLFAYATAPQRAAFDLAMADLRGLDAPRYDRARDAAKRTFEETTAAARALCDETVSVLIESGSSEVPEAISFRWEELAVSGAMLEAAE